MPGGTPDSAKVAQELMVAPALLSKQTRGLYPPPQAVLASIVTQAKRQNGKTAKRQHGNTATRTTVVMRPDGGRVRTP